eukprot:scaffold12692_cov67-Phaeocystis_antarctica.AAC.4
MLTPVGDLPIDFRGRARTTSLVRRLLCGLAAGRLSRPTCLSRLSRARLSITRRVVRRRPRRRRRLLLVRLVRLCAAVAAGRRRAARRRRPVVAHVLILAVDVSARRGRAFRRVGRLYHLEVTRPQCDARLLPLAVITHQRLAVIAHELHLRCTRVAASVNGVGVAVRCYRR